jgi:uncharacterized protein (TIGR01244 family)
MEPIARIDGKVAVGGQPSAEDLRQLRAQGYTTVVNLRLDGEASQPLSPTAEGRAATDAGLAYRHVPVRLADLDPEQVQEVRAAIASAPGPVYVHCGAGQRACAVALLATGGAADLAGRAAELGFPITDERLRRFVDEEQGRP